MKHRFATLMACLTILLSPVAHAAADRKVTGSSNAPLAYQIFCLRNPAECQKSGKDKMAYTTRVRALLESVNRQVNASISYRKDNGEVWSSNVRSGDCEDYALTKRARLIRLGIPSGTLRMAVVKTPKGEGHAVLVAVTTSGDFILDSLNRKIIPRQYAHYRFISQSTEDPMRWLGR